MKCHSTPPPHSPTIHGLHWVVCHTAEVGIWDDAKGVQWDLDQGIVQATPILEYCCLKTIVFLILMCASGHCPAKCSVPSNFSKLSSIPSSKISQYCSAFIFPWTSTSFPTPFHPIQPHTIRLFPPPCLTIGVVVQSDNGSPYCFQTYTLPSDPMKLILVSSDHNTLFQSSTVQFSWYLANLSRLW